jgi:hypothetical protein
MSPFLLRTDHYGHRWEIRRQTDGTIEHRREGRVHWIDGWPSSLPLLKEGEDPLVMGQNNSG